MSGQPPYRGRAAPELRIDWETEAGAMAGLESLVLLLRDRGVSASDGALEVRLRPRVQAFVDAAPEPEVAVYVAWEIAREANRVLSEAGSEARFHRISESASCFVLLEPAEVHARRHAGEVLLTEPPKRRSARRELLAFAGALLAFATMIGSLVAVGAFLALAATVAAYLLASAVRRPIARRSPMAAALLSNAVLVIPCGVLVQRGELLLLGLVLVSCLVSWAAQRALHRALQAEHGP